MGLDMYLTGKRYLSPYSPEDAKLIGDIQNVVGSDMPTSDIKEISVRAAYWSKANQVHKWFVDNVQDGEDECNEHDVSIEQLQDLRDLCAQVLEAKDEKMAGELLPPSRGFFGSGDIDEWYYNDLKLTVEQLTPLIDKAESLNGWYYSYRSSW